MSTISATPTSPPAAAGRDHRWLILVIVSVAQLMVVLDATIVNIALPSAQKALGFSNDGRQWIVTSYALAFGSLLLLGGRIGDMFGRKWAFLGGMAGFAIASAVGGASTSFGMLVAARALQGAFGAVLAPAALSTLVNTFTDPKERGKAFGIFGSVAGGGGAVGLVLGGILTEYLSWRWCLYVNLGFAAVAGFGGWRLMVNVRPPSRPRIDFVGVGLASAGLFAVVFGFAHVATASWSSGVTIIALVAGALLLSAFVYSQTRVSAPLLPLRIITDPARGGAYAAVGIAGIAIFGVFLFVSYYLQIVKGFSPVSSGLAFLPMMGGILLASNTSTIVLLPRFGPRVLIATGMSFGCAAMIYLAQLSASSTYAGGILPALIVMGLGFGMIVAPAINTATSRVAPNDAGIASALVNTMQQVGGSVGTAVLSTVAASATASYAQHHRGADHLAAVAATHGYTSAFTIAAILFGVGAVITTLIMPSRPVHQARLQDHQSQLSSPVPAHG
ncbi:MAG TPA: MFS transporter [Mycobacterium sp.]|jgi:EmrB/QacA subfamily drug resistance transporter|nr:MFS transporter [Mycobacterium sp.]